MTTIPKAVAAIAVSWLSLLVFMAAWLLFCQLLTKGLNTPVADMTVWELSGLIIVGNLAAAGFIFAKEGKPNDAP